MRLDGRNGDAACVWHAEECRQLFDVIWVDDEIHTYAQFTGRVFEDSIEVIERKVKKVWIVRAQSPGLVIINPAEDRQDADVMAKELERV